MTICRYFYSEIALYLLANRETKQRFIAVLYNETPL